MSKKGRRKPKPFYHFRPPQKNSVQKRTTSSVSQKAIIDGRTPEQVIDYSESLNTKSGIFAKIFAGIFYYPVTSHSKKVLYFAVNSVALWLLVGYGLSRFLFKFPDFGRVPKPMLELSGTLLISAGTIHFVMLVRVFRYRTFMTHSMEKLIAVQDTLARVFSTIAIMIVLFYASGAVEKFSQFLGAYLPILGQGAINVLSYIYASLGSIITGVISNMIFAYIVRIRRKAKMRKKRESKERGVN